MKNLLKKSPMITSILVLIITYGFYELPFWDESSLDHLLIREVIVGAVLFICIGIIAGKKEIMPSVTGLGYAFKLTWFILFLTFLISALNYFTLFVGAYFTDHIFIKILKLIVFTLFIGFYEEGLFRGLFYNAFLKKWGGSYKGIRNAAIWSALLFGALHIVPSLVQGNLTDIISICTALGKTIQTAFLGFILAVVYVRTKNFWSIAIIHGLNDFIVFLSTFLINNPNALGDVGYTSGGSMGLLLIGMYVLMALLSLPPVIISLKQLKQTKLPQYGFFVEEWEPVRPSETEIEK